MAIKNDAGTVAGWFGLRLKELRTAAGLDRQALADRAGLAQAGLANLEQCRNQPSWATVVALVQALGVKADAFLQEPSAKVPGRGRPRKEEEEKPAAKKQTRSRRA